MKREDLEEHTVLSDACEVLRRSYDRGWISTRDGNVSMRSRDGSLLISPSGVRKYALKPEDFIRVRRSSAGFTMEGPTRAAQPSGELELHLAVQELLPPDLGAVLHLHPTYILAAMFAHFRLAAVAQGFPEVSRYTVVGPEVPALPAT